MLLEMASDSPFMAASGREGCSDVTWSTAQMERQGAKPRLDQKHLLGCGQWVQNLLLFYLGTQFHSFFVFHIKLFMLSFQFLSNQTETGQDHHSSMEILKSI